MLQTDILRARVRPFLERLLRDTPLNPDWLIQRAIAADLGRLERFASGLTLDLGCRRQPAFPRRAASRHRYVTVDLAPEVRPALVADVMRLPFRDRAVQAVVLSQVIEHLPDPLGALHEIRRVLREDDGALLLSYPLVYPIHGAPDDYLRFTPAGMEQVLRRTGFIVADGGAHGGFGALLAANVNYVLSRPLAALGEPSYAWARSLALGLVLLPLIVLVNLAALPIEFLVGQSHYAMAFWTRAVPGRRTTE